MKSIEREIMKRWLDQHEDKRAGSDAERVAQEAWDLHLRLAKHEHTHYQLVMDLVRWSVRE
ncbi:hypothetical protein OMR58_22475 [Erwinia sp. INIA-01]|uniref:hypothetical protein n=1 Tax=Erwinia sp. INIA01 TaxID=2991500 RepID=UPI002225402C|nr:hypothetical protein [Erwinia sp. INIA01]MCW1877218.1 hypothetical protein [Erwinia sp. INIA01]